MKLDTSTLTKAERNACDLFARAHVMPETRRLVILPYAKHALHRARRRHEHEIARRFQAA